MDDQNLSFPRTLVIAARSAWLGFGLSSTLLSAGDVELCQMVTGETERLLKMKRH